MSQYGDRRKFKRIKIKSLSRINNKECSIINISRDGMLLGGNIALAHPHVSIQLKINGKWIDLEGTQMWAIQADSQHHTRLGVYITQAPPEYKDFIDNLYFEADES